MTAELPLSIEERLARLEKMFNKLKAPPMDLLLQEGYLQIGSSGNTGAARFERYGVQIAGQQVSAIWFTPTLQPDPNSYDGSKAYMWGSVSPTSGASKITLTAIDVSPPTAPHAAGDVEIGIENSVDSGRVVLRGRVDGDLTGGGEWAELWVNRTLNQDAGTVQLYQALLRLCPIQGSGYDFTSDPGNAIEGDIWYNTTDNKFKGVDASATKAFLMEGDVVGMPTPITMGPGATLAIGTELASRASTGPTSGTFPAANRAILYPFYLTEDITVTQLWSYNGATASGNIDVGIYDSAFARQVSSGSTAQSGTNVLQVFDVTDTPLTAGQYYMAVAMDNTTGTLFRQAQQADFMRSVGCFQMASAFALPSTITPASVTSAYVPHVGWTRKTTI